MESADTTSPSRMWARATPRAVLPEAVGPQRTSSLFRFSMKDLPAATQGAEPGSGPLKELFQLGFGELHRHGPAVGAVLDLPSHDGPGHPLQLGGAVLLPPFDGSLTGHGGQQMVPYPI